MRTKVTLSLSRDLKRWVDQQVKTGGYGTASEYLRDFLLRARARQNRRSIDAALIAAIESGANTTMDKADWAEIRRAAR